MQKLVILLVDTEAQYWYPADNRAIRDPNGTAPVALWNASGVLAVPGSKSSSELTGASGLTTQEENKMRKGPVLVVVALALACASASYAGHIDLPVKWSQTPDMGLTAYDLRAEHPVVLGGQVVADDWKCTDPNPVVAVRWWGSYLNKAYEPAQGSVQMLPFEMSFHIGDSVPPPNSEPGTQYEVFFVYAQEDWYGLDANNNGVWEYNAYLTDPWVQTVGQIYWLDVELDVGRLAWPFYTWGWHNTDKPWGDKTVFSTVGHNGPWNIDCPGQAFELMVPEPGSLAALALGACGMAGWALRIRRRR